MKKKKKKNWKHEKYIIQKKTPTKLSWPVSAKSDKKILFKKTKQKNPQDYVAHECQIWYLITRFYI